MYTPAAASDALGAVPASEVRDHAPSEGADPEPLEPAVRRPTRKVHALRDLQADVRRPPGDDGVDRLGRLRVLQLW